MRELLLLALTPLAQALHRLDSRQQETRGLVEQLALRPQEETPLLQEIRELQLETLQAMQPSAEEEISQLIGLALPASSSPSSVS